MENLKDWQKIELRQDICGISLSWLHETGNFEFQGELLFKLGFDRQTVDYNRTAYGDSNEAARHRLIGYDRAAQTIKNETMEKFTLSQAVELVREGKAIEVDWPTKDMLIKVFSHVCPNDHPERIGGECYFYYAHEGRWYGENTNAGRQSFKLSQITEDPKEEFVPGEEYEFSDKENFKGEKTKASLLKILPDGRFESIDEFDNCFVWKYARKPQSKEVELNRWYKQSVNLGKVFYKSCGGIPTSTSIAIKGFGFSVDGNWRDEIAYFSENLTEMSNEEVLQALTTEAKKRGLVEGVCFKGVEPNGGGETIHKCNGEYFYCKIEHGLYSNEGWLMKNGQWATPVQTTTREEVLNETGKYVID